MSEKQILLLNIHGYAHDLHGYLSYYYLGPNHSVDEKKLIEALEELLINLIRDIIDHTRDARIPNKGRVYETDAFIIYGEKTNLDPKKVKPILLDSICLDNLLDSVHKMVSIKPWGVYLVNKERLEYVGDFRILEWETDHLNERGEYVE